MRPTQHEINDLRICEDCKYWEPSDLEFRGWCPIFHLWTHDDTVCRVGK